MQDSLERTGMTATKSASNALKHGLTSLTFVPDHARDFVESIRIDLTSLHQPQTSDETSLVAELAVALWQNYEHDRRFYENKAYELSIADDLFAEQASAKCRDDLAGLRTSPGLNQFRLTESYLGSVHLQGLFQSVLTTLSQNLPISFQQITDCINAVGEDWRLDTLSTQAGHLMGLHLALVENPETEINQWVAQSQLLSQERAELLARHHHAQAPSAEKALAELTAKLGRELARVAGRISHLKEQFDERRRLFKAASAGFGLHEPRGIRAAMLAMRYRTAAYNRSERIQKELEKRKCERAETSPATVYTHRLPAQATADSKPLQPSTINEVAATKPASPQASKPPAAQSLRNETAPAPFKPLTPAKTGHKMVVRPVSNRKTQLARLAKQAK